MVRKYDVPPESFPLKQGEVLCNLVEVIPGAAEIEGLLSDTPKIPVYPTSYPYVIVVSQDCDLIQDWGARNQKELDESKLLTHIQFCELFEEADIRPARRLDSQ